MLSKKVMLLWALLAFVTLLIGTSLPPYSNRTSDYGFSLAGWTLAIAVSFAATFWMELLKILGKTV